jgi:hypothetical protein
VRGLHEAALGSRRARQPHSTATPQPRPTGPPRPSSYPLALPEEPRPGQLTCYCARCAQDRGHVQAVLLERLVGEPLHPVRRSLGHLVSPPRRCDPGPRPRGVQSGAATRVRRPASLPPSGWPRLARPARRATRTPAVRRLAKQAIMEPPLHPAR